MLLFVSTTVVGALLSPHPVGPQPSALGDFSVPTAEEGRAIPVVFGTCMIKGGNTVWWGDLRTKAIRIGGGILSFGRSQVTGYQYFLGCQFMLCHGPVDALVDIQADVKSIPRTASVVNNGNGSENYIQVTATGDNLFGGDKVPGGEGGISGIINFYRGLDTQQPDDYLGAKQGRIVLDQSGIGYTFTGTGNGTITAESAGSSSLDETITITAVGIDGNALHSTFGKMKFSVVGSLSGTQHNSTLNPEGSNDCWADQAFSCSVINMTIQTGSTQYANGDKFVIVTQHAKIAPAYRRMCYAVFKQLYVGTSSYLKPLAFVVRRCPDPLSQGSSIANINGDANGALAVYEMLTNVDYGLGIPTVRMGSSWSAAAVTLAGEGLGISMMFDTQASADQLIGEVLRHIDGLIYTDPATGLWEIVLARGGYDPSTLTVLTVDNVIATPDFSRGSWSETTNLVTINFSSRLNNFNDRVVRAYDAANIKVTNEVRSQTIDFKGISQEAAAGLVAIRVLKTLTYPLSKIKIVANRSAWQFRPGGLFRFTWVPLGIINQIFRITRIGYGELTDGKITIDAAEDIFGISDVAFTAPPASGWVNPIGAPVPNLQEKVTEVPLDVMNVDGIAGGGSWIMCMAARDPSVLAKTFQVWRDDGSGYADTGYTGPFCPWAKLSVAYPPNTLANDPGGFTVDGSTGIDLDLLSGVTSADLANAVNLALIDDEIISWETVTLNGDGSYTFSHVLRGLMDTVSATHAINAPVFFFSSGATVGGFVIPDGTVSIKMLPTNSAGTLPIGSAAAHSIATTSRGFERPYPPGNVRMQGLAYGSRFRTIVGDLVLTWSDRNRFSQAGTRPIIQQDASGVSAEPSFGYEYEFVINGASKLVADLGLVDTLTVTATTRVGFGPTDDSPLTVLLRSYRTGAVIPGLAGTQTYFSWQDQRMDVIFTGFGLCFGEFFGGINS